MTNRKLKKIGKVRILGKIIPSFLISKFSILPYSENRKFGFKNLGKILPRFLRFLRFSSFRPGPITNSNKSNIIFHHFLKDIFEMAFKKWSCKLKKWWKMTKKKRKKKSSKKWQSRTCSTLSFYHFLNDENHAQIVSPGKKKLIRQHVLKHEWMEAAFAVHIFVYTRWKKAWINFFKLFNY